MGEIIEFASNGTTAQGYLATEGTGPGVVVIQEYWGLVDHIKELCDRFAAQGFVALAPDLYHGATVTLQEPDEAAKLMMAMRMEQAAEDMSGAVDAVKARCSSHGVGVVGFCMGGGLALVLGCQRPDLVKAVAPFYGLIPWADAQPDYSKLEAAVQGHFAENDASAGPKAARELEDTLTRLGKRARMYIYPGTQHAFFNDQRPEVFDATAAREAWEKLLPFLRDELH
jgi:carboxymethylenebutenolidase